MGSNDVVARIKAEAAGHELECTPETLNAETFASTGALVIRGLVSPVTAGLFLDDWKALAWDSDGVRKLDHNPVNSDAVPQSLIEFSRSSRVVDLLSPVFGAPLGLWHRQVLAKDASYEGDVFLHQDTCYQRGGLHKGALFLALTDVNEDSGGLEIWLGTHKFGYLGDAGEIDGSVLPADWPRVVPTLTRGDAVLMDCNAWHRSGPNTSGRPRVFGTQTYQPGDDPSSREIIGLDGWFEQMTPFRSDQSSVFARGRVTTIQRLQARVDELEAAAAQN